MPKIEVNEDSLYKYIGKKITGDEFIKLLSVAKAEFDGQEGDILKIELNDTNRPDLWSAPGLGRQLRQYLGGERKEYPFFSMNGNVKESGSRIIEVDPALKDIRPYVTGFAVKGKSIDEALLKDIIQTQEKICWNYGQKRRSIAMGIYRSDLFTYPVKYFAANPDKEAFVPLGLDKKLTLREVIKQHQKGQEFGAIIAGFDKYPYLVDSQGKALSLPPVTNSNDIGAVVVGDKELFVEMTGTDIYSLLLATSIVACDLYDAGYEVFPVKTVYPYDTPLGREITAPFYFQQPVKADITFVNKWLGESFTVEEAANYARKMGCRVEVNGENIVLNPAEYRNDFLHSVDIIEDIMIGKGLTTFEPVMTDDFTMGRLTDATIFGRKIKNIMVGLGFQEMIYNYLGSAKDFIEKMNINGSHVIKIANPMSENFEYLRPSIIPSLLNSESVSGNAVYPHKIFETGKVAVKDPKENYGTITINSLGFLSADKDAGFNLVSSQLSAIMFYISVDYTLEEAEDGRFIKGRCAQIISNGKIIGIMGEINPQVLENWGISVPCAACEINLDLLL
ncbi:MAG: phenylalanine--tRNA ligase subunit beta [Spirochaetes bacterium]|nr:phenylalanine--tRNA ligase subunit beta [Spirochaetota bacterium]